MKFFFLIVLVFIALDAKTSGKRITATVVAKNATLFQKPYECSAKKVNYYKRGDRVVIDYCNQYRWCKTKYGYIKRDKLSIKLPQTIQQPPKQVLQAQPQEVQRTSIESSYLLPVKKEQKKERRLELIPYVSCKSNTDIDHYEAYFTPQSSELLSDDNSSL